MDNKSKYQTLFAYHWHTTQRLLDCAVPVDETAYRADSGYGGGSIHNLFYHLLATDWMWRHALESGQQPTPPARDDYPDLDALRAGFEAEQQGWDAYLAALSPADFDATVDLITRRGGQFPVIRWRVLEHLVFHGMQHHSELAQLLTAQGRSPGDIDFIFFNQA